MFLNYFVEDVYVFHMVFHGRGPSIDLEETRVCSNVDSLNHSSRWSKNHDIVVISWADSHVHY